MLANPESPSLPNRPNQVFVSRNLRLDQISIIGFDMDYTLARYHRKHLETLAHRITLDKLLKRGYPDAIKSIKYDPDFVIRGLTVDKQLGNILKLDRHSHVGHVFHGRRKLTNEERRKVYRSEKIHFEPPRFATVDTLFSLPEMCLYADLVDFFEQYDGPKIDNWQLFVDTRECIDEAHKDNSLKSIVTADLPHYVEKEPMLAKTLHKLRSSGKKLFLLTNSYYKYTDKLMSYLLNDELSEYPAWQAYFDVVIVGASKPGFFTKNEPFAKLDEDGTIIERPIKKFERSGLYQGGNRKSFEKFVRYSGEEILYVGDHIYGDILRSKKASLWRTALVVEELEDEITIISENTDLISKINLLEKERRELDALANLQRQELSSMEKAEEKTQETSVYSRLKKDRDRIKRQLRQVSKRINTLETQLEQQFNKNWGLVFKEGQETSRFGKQVNDYACLYTSRVTNFFGYSNYQYFRGAPELLPHEQT
ncbi:MAG: HAD-IG family 5'-nucleotidase [Myxococcota bacterium]|nr:HAD-IG family 5'-nucleotidase [Myxococcota bacterium]